MEEAKTIIRTAVRTFQANTTQTLLVDCLLHHTVLHLDDFNCLTSIPQKELRGILQPLRTARLIHTHGRREHHVATQRDGTREYYYVHHSDAVNAVKYRLNKLRQEIQNQYLTASGPDTFRCPQCSSTWMELDVIPGPGGELPCPKCGFSDVILNEAAFKNQGAHENVALLNSQLSKFNTLFAAFDTKLANGQFKDLKFEEQFQRRKIIPKSEGGRSWLWVDVKRGRERDTAAGAVDENALDLNITSAARQAAEEAARERDRKEKVAQANAKPEWMKASVVKGGTLDIRGDASEPISAGPDSNETSTAALKKEEDTDDKKSLNLGDTKGAQPEGDRTQQALMEQYMLAMQQEQEEADRRKREKDENEDEDDEEDDEDDEFEDVPGTGTGAVGTPVSSQEANNSVKPATVPAVNGIKREYDDDSSDAATPASEERDAKRPRVDNNSNVKSEPDGSGSTPSSATPAAASSANAPPAGRGPGAGAADDESDDEEFEDV